MSGTRGAAAAVDDDERIAGQGAGDDNGGAGGGEAGGGDLEARARRLGWKPKEEFRSGAPADWLDAAEFVRRGEEELPLIRARNRRLEENLEKLERRVGESVTVIQDLTERFRTADTRAYDRARANLEAERDAAVENADTATYRQKQAEIKDLEAAAPKPAAPAAPAVGQPPAEVLAWAERNPWMTTDQELNAEARAQHEILKQTKPGMSLSDNLEETTRRVKALHPDKFTNARRAAAPAVSGSTTEGGRAPRSNGRTFDDMPADSRTAFAKYAKSLAGKGKPLTKEEWAKDYWDQE